MCVSIAEVKKCLCFNSCVTKMKSVFVCVLITKMKMCLCANSCITKMKSVFVCVLIAKMKNVCVCQHLCVME